MFNCIESDALMGMCRALGLRTYWINGTRTMPQDVYIVSRGLSEEQIKHGGECNAYRLSDYLLATAPIDVKEA